MIPVQSLLVAGVPKVHQFPDRVLGADESDEYLAPVTYVVERLNRRNRIV